MWFLDVAEGICEQLADPLLACEERVIVTKEYYTYERFRCEDFDLGAHRY